MVAAVTNILGDAWLDVLEPQQLLVPTDIAGGEAGGVTASDSKSAPLLMCYSAKSHGDERNERKPLTLTEHAQPDVDLRGWRPHPAVQILRPRG